jgi:protein-tyrosine phosphatase
VFRAVAARVAPTLKVEADSAGTHDYHVGAAPDPRAQRVAALRGIDMSSLRARLLRADDFERFDYVLVMDRNNLSAARGLAPPQRRDRIQLLLDYAPQQPLREVPDPYYGGEADFELVFELTQQAAHGLVQRLSDRTS